MTLLLPRFSCTVDGLFKVKLHWYQISSQTLIVWKKHFRWNKTWVRTPNGRRWQTGHLKSVEELNLGWQKQRKIHAYNCILILMQLTISDLTCLYPPWVHSHTNVLSCWKLNHMYQMQFSLFFHLCISYICLDLLHISPTPSQKIVLSLWSKYVQHNTCSSLRTVMYFTCISLFVSWNKGFWVT